MCFSAEIGMIIIILIIIAITKLSNLIGYQLFYFGTNRTV